MYDEFEKSISLSVGIFSLSTSYEDFCILGAYDCPATMDLARNFPENVEWLQFWNQNLI